jgi:two-component system, chemotaxis family, chemotaxis protein CheY
MALNVMIVDDSLIMAQKLKVMLSELGHNVARICQDGEEAIRDYALVKPDLVTMDITMPGRDGIDTMKAILANHPNALFVMVTSHGQEAMVVRAIDAGALGYVLKPVTKDRLSAMLARAVSHSVQRASHAPRTVEPDRACSSEPTGADAAKAHVVINS